MRAQLGEAALRVVAVHGPEAATIDLIVQAAGVARGTFYKYYVAPADLIQDVGTELAQELILAVGQTLEGLDDPALRLCQGFRSILALVKENPLLGDFLIRADWPVTDHVPAFTDLVMANIAAGLEQGRFRATSLAVARATVGGLSIGMMAELIAPGAKPGIDDEAAVTLLLALGLAEAEAKAIVALPLGAPFLPTEGLLSRARVPGIAVS